MGISDGADVPYTVTRFTSVGDEIPNYYQMFTMEFSSVNALQKILISSEM